MASAAEQGLTCCVCLDIFDDPRVLPACLHTFCAKCVQDVSDSHQGRPFPCPSCREQTTLPSGGVMALRKNFYIKPEDLDRARKGIFLCGVHSDQRLDLYCNDCQKALCVKCGMTKHSDHKKIDLSEAASVAKDQLRQDKARLSQASATISVRIRETQKELEALQQKKKAVEKNARNRHAAALALLDKQLTETLSSLEETCAPIESRLKEELDNQEQSKKRVDQLQGYLQEALTKDSACNLMDAARDMSEGQGRREVISRLIAEERDTVERPVLHCKDLSTEDFAKHVADFLGSVNSMELSLKHQGGTTVERFGIPEAPDAEVFSLCVSYGGDVYLSYTWLDSSNRAGYQEFKSNGSLHSTHHECGKVSLKSYGKLCLSYSNQKGDFRTQSKSKEPYALHNKLSAGMAAVEKNLITCIDPYKVTNERKFLICCGPHRAFDVDSTGQYFVVVEEAPPSERSVLLFERGELGSERRVSEVYNPPRELFCPSDACFFTKDGQQVLLIADLNDAIHVVTVGSGAMRFHGYLCAGDPRVVQPTALTVDSSNRVWVACKGRVILIVCPDLTPFF